MYRILHLAISGRNIRRPYQFPLNESKGSTKFLVRPAYAADMHSTPARVVPFFAELVFEETPF